MGSPQSETKREDIESQHRVRITKPLYLGVHEVTVGQFRRFVEAKSYRTEAEQDGKGGYGYNESTGNSEQDAKYTWRNCGFAQGEDHPVVNVSWNDAKAFCDWLSAQEGKTYRLPTEAE
jgi:formylglycine-generating enzyme required for sulfatase activity